MESKYKIGDKVTIKKTRNKPSDDYRFSFTDLMLSECGGRECTIESIVKAEKFTDSPVSDDGYRYRLKEVSFTWASSMFEDSSEALSLDLSTDNSLDAFIKRNKRPELDFNL